MKTDALLPFRGRNEGKVAKRMDCSRDTHSGNAVAGFADATVQKSRKKPFSRVMADVAGSNRVAQHVTDTTMTKRMDKQRGQQRRSTDTSLNNVDAPFLEALQLMAVSSSEVSLDGDLQLTGDAQQQPQDEMLLLDAQTAQAAQAVVKDALTAISDKLGLAIFPELEKLKLDEVGSETKAQFAEIIYTLKKIVQGFDASSAEGTAVTTPREDLLGSAIGQTADVLRTGVFSVELACNIMGIGEEVQQQVAEKMASGGSLGILQASNPEDLSMSVDQSERLFGGLMADKSEAAEIATLTRKVQELIAEQCGDKPDIGLVKGSVAEGSAKAYLEEKQFDASVYRELLKINSPENVAEQNTEAAESSEKKSVAQLFEGKIVTARSAEEVKSTERDETPLLPVGSTLQPVAQTGEAVKISSALARMSGDEKIMQQITEKVQLVVRSGVTEVRVQLRPEALGEVRMRIRMEGDIVIAKIDVANQQVKEIVERNLPMLKDALAQQNLQTGNVDVSVNHDLERFDAQNDARRQDDQDTLDRTGTKDTKKEDHDGFREEYPEHPTGETGRRFGSNSVEYFA